jgi:hypothetical protein
MFMLFDVDLYEMIRTVKWGRRDVGGCAVTCIMNYHYDIRLGWLRKTKKPARQDSYLLDRDTSGVSCK